MATWELENRVSAIFAICVLVLFPVYIYVFWWIENKKAKGNNKKDNDAKEA